MSNKYGISRDDEGRIRTRDETCAYCHKKMIDPKLGGPRSDWATIEHLNYLPPWDNSVTVVICCGSCNSSRGIKKILDWFNTPYCLEKKINLENVTKPVKNYVDLVEDFVDRLTWVFAKTMPEIPHYYVVRDSLSKEDQNKFDRFFRYIKKEGYSDTFDSKKYTYLKLGRYKYWIIENILNRAEF
jgi:hypothetical protein